MKKKTQRIVVIVLAIVMLLSVLGPLLATMADAITKDDINDIKDELSDISAQKAQTLKELESIRGDKSQAKRQIQLIQGQITDTEHEISLSWELLEGYDTAIEEKEGEVADLKAQEEEQYDQFCSHVRWVEETGSVTYLSILFECGTFAELLDRLTLIGDIMDYSNNIITDLENTRAEVYQAQIELEAARIEQREAHEDLEGHLAELEVLEDEAQRLYDSIAAHEADLAAEARELAAAEAEMKDDLAKAEKEYAAQIAALNNSGAWTWPTPGYYRISSVFGGRISPITGRWETHTGTDIPAPRGTPILAAQGGVVTISKWNVSYGWYVTINHGDGKSTRYAHMYKKPSVSEGQTVKKGQTIGYVGSTGDSTGNHLHFELLINGARSDVLKLYPNLPYTGPYVDIIKERLGKK